MESEEVGTTLAERREGVVREGEEKRDRGRGVSILKRRQSGKKV